MAAAGPSSSRDAVTPPSSVSRASHVRFPLDYDPNSAAVSKQSQQLASLGLGRPPTARRATSRSSTHDDQSNLKVQPQSEDARQRVKSAEPMSSPGPSRTRMGPEFVTNSSRRATPPAHRFTSRRARTRGGLADAEGEGDNVYTSKTFSDEYDLANEDPRILEDVQRAIRMKARREARAKQPQLTNQADKKVTSTSDMASGSSLSPRSSPKRLAVPSPILPPPAGSFESEIDFSPSVGTVPLHPVPSSTNGGATLDWTIPTFEDEKVEKRWRTLSIMRKPREKFGLPSSKEVIEKQDSLYSDKLTVIKAKVQPLTLRKAAITKDQLERQYSALLWNSGSHAGTPNILSAVRWFAGQDDGTKLSLEKAEPLTWLKHLLDKSRRKSPRRLPWHVTALIMEEYLKIKHRPDAMETIPENGVVVDSLVLRPSPGSLVYSGDKSPSSGSWSWTPPNPSLEPSLSRKRVSHDGQISFEPIVDSGRESIGDEPKFNDNPIANWIHSRAGGTTSPRNSTQSSLSHANWAQGTSPNNSRLNFRDLAHRIRRRPYGGSEEGLSSARNSISEQSQDDVRPASHNRKRPRRLRNSSLQILSSRSAPPTDDEGDSREHIENQAAHSDGEIPSTAKPVLSTQASPAEQKKPAHEEMSPRQKTTALPRHVRRRVSLPFPNQFFVKQSAQRHHEADEVRERQDYERKVQMLEDTIAQNHATRQVLQRISHQIKEYSNVQASLSQDLGVTELPLPPDVIDAFNHDPSAVMGRTKRHRGWRAVEDIHERIVRQRQTINIFSASIMDTVTSPTRSVFEEPISGLIASLNSLDIQQESVAVEAETVSEALQRVKGVHSSVKREYNETLSHTSLIYPELSQIITLEENYRNHYQQLWNIGLDALTLLLDTVTPFWRNYGKVIGEDIQDFLVIPWYRNEFTGEPNWYPIQHLPKRSLRHWVGLVFCSIALVAMTMLQLRAALSSTCIFNLPWLADIGVRWLVFPFFIIALIIQWSAVLFESLLLLAQTGVFIWWLGWSIHIFV